MNSFGSLFRVQIYGESHGIGIGVIIDGVPAGISLTKDDFTNDLNRRRAGIFGTTSRKEQDIPIFISGIYNNFTTGAPINIFLKIKMSIQNHIIISNYILVLDILILYQQ